jgi:HEPN domain
VVLPKSNEARIFYRCAKQRFEEAKVLDENSYGTGAMYLAGYGVECILKALILDSLAAKPKAEILKEFRGQRAHNFDWLRNQYRNAGGPPFPRQITEAFLLVTDWSTDLRYMAGVRDPDDVAAFLSATEAIIKWADERF